MSSDEKAVSPPKLVIDFTDGEIKTITSDTAVDVVVTSFDDTALKEAVRTSSGPEDLSVIPNDLGDPDDGASAGVFETYPVDIDKESVEDVHGYVNDTGRVSTYARIVLQMLENDQVDE